MSVVPQVFGLTVLRDLDRAVVQLSGELDVADVDALQAALIEVIDDEGHVTIELEVEHLEIVDSAVVELLVRTARKLSRRGGELVLTGPTPAVVRVLQATNVERFFTISPG